MYCAPHRLRHLSLFRLLFVSVIVLLWVTAFEASGQVITSTEVAKKDSIKDSKNPSLTNGGQGDQAKVPRKKRQRNGQKSNRTKGRKKSAQSPSNDPHSVTPQNRGNTSPVDKSQGGAVASAPNLPLQRDTSVKPGKPDSLNHSGSRQNGVNTTSEGKTQRTTLAPPPISPQQHGTSVKQNSPNSVNPLVPVKSGMDTPQIDKDQGGKGASVQVPQKPHDTSVKQSNPDSVQNVNVLVLTGAGANLPMNVLNALRVGLKASLSSRQNKVTDNVMLTLIERDIAVEKPQDIVSSLGESNTSIIAVVALVEDEALRDTLPALKKQNLVAFAPFMRSGLLRKWDPNLYFLQAGPSFELFALVRFAVSYLRRRRLGFMYVKDALLGESEYKYCEHLLSQMGYNLSGVFVLHNGATESKKEIEFQHAWEAFVKTSPQAVFVFGEANDITAKFVKRLLTDKRTRGVYILSPFSLQDLLMKTLKDVVASGIPFLPGSIMTSGTNPLSYFTHSSAIKLFKRAVQRYIRVFCKDMYADPYHYLNNSVDGEFMVTGWLTGEVLAQAMSSQDLLNDRVRFSNSLFEQRRYIITDLLVGDYGGDCNSYAVSQGAICHCNQGGKNIYIKRFIEDFRIKNVAKGKVLFDASDCYATSVKMLTPLNGVTFEVRAESDNTSIHSEFTEGAQSCLVNEKIVDSREFRLDTITTENESSADESLLDLLENTTTTTVIGFVTDAMLNDTRVTFINPIQLPPRPHTFRRHVLHLSATVEQQLFVLAQYLAAGGGGPAAHLVARGGAAGAVAVALRRSLAAFGGALLSAAAVRGGGALAQRLPRGGDVFVTGAAPGDAAAIAAHVARHTGVRVLLLFGDVCAAYGALSAALRGGGAAGRVLFATSLPHWADGRGASATVAEFHAAAPDRTSWTPLALVGFATAKLLRAVAPRLGAVGAADLADFFYANVVVRVDDMQYGPFHEESLCKERDVPCNGNAGASSLSVWSFARALDPNVSELFSVAMPVISYKEPVNDKGSALRLESILPLVICGFVVLTGSVLAIVFCRKSEGARDNRNAPKDMEHPVTLIFTDIQSSTALWAAIPEFMADALETHHRLIRRLIVKYECYEVKTIGDSFMIACKSASAAVQLVGDLQRTFLQHDWGTSAIDAAYHEFEERQAEEDADYEPPTARLDAAVYRKYWSGLRVRAGVHTGLSDIRHDEVTRGYDYYGSTSNTAARTESVAHGGQVLLTGAAYMALSAAERAGLDVTALGPVELRGVPQPVEMYQLNAVPGRAFAELRLDKECEYDEESMSSAEGDTCDSVCTISSSDASLVNVVRSCFGPMDPKRRVEVLRNLCKCWGVRVAMDATNHSVNDYCDVLICKLAFKIGRTLNHKGDRNMGLHDDGHFVRSSFVDKGSDDRVSSSPKDSLRSFPSSSSTICLTKPPLLLVDDVDASIVTVFDIPSDIVRLTMSMNPLTGQKSDSFADYGESYYEKEIVFYN